ncbi:hypothetical protein [Nocardia sputi]|uniref:hypothetical protein n=1 Tax=Nocardia sputi TaxID=2943705 RepID=UPI0020C095EE|nr:hypothetical protein [Nocardia sputi]
MTATLPSRTVCARLLVVLAALGGIALAHGLQCEDGMPAMSAPMSMTHSIMQSAQTTGGAADQMDQLVAGTLPAVKTVGDAVGEPMTLGGILAACMVVVLTWLAISTLRLRQTSAVLVCPIRAGPTRAARAASPRAPTLAQLCVLRT